MLKDKGKVIEGVKLILEGIGISLDDENFRDTPVRYANFLEELLEPKVNSDDYVRYTASSSGIVMVSGIRAYGLCPHHLLPVAYEITVAYIPNGNVVGLSKLARVAKDEASKIQLHEQTAERIADRISELTGSSDVMVIVRAVHYCMVMRGVKAEGSETTVVTARGRLRDPTLQSIVLSLAGGQ